MPPSGLRKRRHHHRSRTGCVPCKARHMRCDEAKPLCHNCFRKGFLCEYTSQSPGKSKSPSPQAMNVEKKTSWSSSVAVFDNISVRRSNIFDKIRKLDFSGDFLTIRTTTIIDELAEELLSLATNDMAMLHTVIVLASKYLVREECVATDLTYFSTYHKFEALRIINKRLNKLESADIDGIIAVVAAMALAEIANGAPGIATHHLNGVKNLLLMRRMTQSKLLSGLVQRMIMVVDVLTAEATATELRFPVDIFGKNGNRNGLGFPNEIHDNLSCPNLPLSHEYSNRIERGALSTICSIDWDTTKIFADLHTLSAQMTAIKAGNQFSEPSGLVSRISAAQDHIDRLIHPRHISTSTGTNSESEDLVPVDSSESENYIASPWAVAGSIFVYRFLLRTPDGGELFEPLVKALKISLENEGPTLWERVSPERVLWAFCIGGYVSGSRERPWFVTGIRRICEHLVIKTWAEAQRCLEKLAWINHPGDSCGSILWAEVRPV